MTATEQLDAAIARAEHVGDTDTLAGAIRDVLALCDEAEAAQTAGLRSEAAIRAALSFGALRVGQIRTAITDALGDK